MELKENLEKIKKQLHEINLNRPLNIFDISLISAREISHSAFLAWLLNPKENHKLGDLFLKEIFALLKINQKYKLSEIEVDTEISEKYRRIDIIIEFENQKICIENKIEDYPTIEQLTDEVELFKPTMMVLLAPKTTLKNFSKELEKIPEIKTISYDQIYKITEKIIKSANSDVRFILQQYIKNLEVNIMANKLNNFNEKSLLYVEHSDEIDEIIEEFEDERKNIWKIFIKRLKKKFSEFNYKHFDNWEYIILQKDNWLKKKEYDIFYIKNKRQTLDGLLREKTREKLLNLPYKKCMENCRKDQYDLLLAKSKICVSTWGMGECVYDDWKAILNETILLKIDTSHVIDYYGIYNEANGYLIYYKHDLSDLEDKINHILENYDYYLKKAKKAKQRLLEYTEDRHIKDFKEIILECI